MLRLILLSLLTVHFLAQLTCISHRYTACSRSRIGRHALVERLARMRSSILIAGMRFCHLRITAIERLRRIVALMAVMMVRHIRMHIRLIVVQVNGFRFGIIRRPVTVVIRRCPRTIRRTTIHIPQRRTLHEDRTYHIVITIQIAVTHYFYIEHVSTAFRDERSNILEIAGS